MYGKAKLIWGIIIGILVAVALFCIVVCIGSGINGLTFGEQICEWFGNNIPSVENTAEQAANVVAFIK